MSKRIIIIFSILILAIIVGAVYFIWQAKKPEFDISKIVPQKKVVIPITKIGGFINFDKLPDASKNGTLVSNGLNIKVANGQIEQYYLVPGIYPVLYLDANNKSFQLDPSYMQILPGENTFSAEVIKAL